MPKKKQIISINESKVPPFLKSFDIKEFKIHFSSKLNFSNIFLQKSGGKCYPTENELINSQLVFDPLFLDQQKNQQQFETAPRNTVKSLLKWFNRNLKRRNYQYLDYEKILTTLSNCEMVLEKSQQMLLLNQIEFNNYLKLYHKIVEAVFEAENELVLCKQNLKTSESNRSPAHRLEAIRTLAKLETEIGNLNAVKEDLFFKLTKRQKQNNSLLNTAQNLKTLFAKEEIAITNAIENNLKSKQRQLIKQQLMTQGFMKNDFNNVLAMESIVAIDTQQPRLSNSSNTSTTFLPNMSSQATVNTTASLNPNMFKRSASSHITSILQKDCTDQNSELLSQIKMPKIFLRDVSGKFISASKSVKNFGKESNNKISIKLNKLHFINNGVQSSILSSKLNQGSNYKVFDVIENPLANSAMVSCR